jgi:hypothetical protein
MSRSSRVIVPREDPNALDLLVLRLALLKLF